MAQSLAAQRRAAAKTLFRQAHAIIAKDGAGQPGLEQIRDRLIALAARPELFPRDDFPMPRNSGCNHLVEAEPEDGFALYVAIALPGKEAAAHEHGVWCINAGIAGRERHSYWRRTDNAKRAGFATVEKTHDVLVRPGTGMCMSEHDIHSNIVIGRDPAISLMLYGYALTRFPAVKWFHPEFSTVRATPSRRPAA